MIIHSPDLSFIPRSGESDAQCQHGPLRSRCTRRSGSSRTDEPKCRVLGRRSRPRRNALALTCEPCSCPHRSPRHHQPVYLTGWEHQRRKRAAAVLACCERYRCHRQMMKTRKTKKTTKTTKTTTKTRKTTKTTKPTKTTTKTTTKARLAPSFCEHTKLGCCCRMNTDQKKNCRAFFALPWQMDWLDTPASSFLVSCCFVRLASLASFSLSLCNGVFQVFCWCAGFV